MELAYPQNVSVPVGSVIQGAYEKVSPNTYCPCHLLSIYLLSGEYIFPVWSLCFITISFGQTEDPEMCLIQCRTRATPSHTIPVDCSFHHMPGYWGWYFVDLKSRGYLPNYSQAAGCGGRQQQERDRARSSLSQRHKIWEVWTVRELWHIPRDAFVWEMHLLLAPMELQIQQELRCPATDRSSIFSFPPSFHWRT